MQPMIKKIFRLTSYTLFLGMLSLLPQQGWSQQETAEQSRPIELTEGQITAFARVYVQVEKINESYQQQLATVTDPQAQQTIVEEVNEKMIAIIQAGGLTVELYNAIIHQIPNDPALKSRIAQEIQEIQNLKLPDSSL